MYSNVNAFVSYLFERKLFQQQDCYLSPNLCLSYKLTLDQLLTGAMQAFIL